MGGAILYEKVLKPLIFNEDEEADETPTEIDDDTDLTDPKTWPAPPGEGPFKEGEPSRAKSRKRGEKSLYDPEGGEYRPHKPDAYHPEGHWDYKAPGPNSPWVDIPCQ